MTYSNHFNYSNCTQGCGTDAINYCEQHYNHAVNTGCNDHSDWGYNNHTNTPHSNIVYTHGNYKGPPHSDTPEYCSHTAAVNTGYNNYYTRGYGNHNDSYTYANYTNHCKQYYSNHTNYSISHPKPYDIGISASTVRSWKNNKKFKDTIEELKTIRAEIDKLSVEKVHHNGAVITAAENPITAANADGKFNADQKVLKAQINETISNVKSLWGIIKGPNNALHLTVPVQPNENRVVRAEDYAIIVERIQDLASIEQSSSIGYANHANSGSGVPGYANATYT